MSTTDDDRSRLAAETPDFLAGSLADDAPEDPCVLVDVWQDDAFIRRSEHGDLPDPTAVVLSTVAFDAEGTPSPRSRTVLLKGRDARGFVLYTNLGSAKGEEIATAPRAALLMPWYPLQRQVRIEGMVEELTSEESDAYFGQRPRGSVRAARRSAPGPPSSPGPSAPVRSWRRNTPGRKNASKGPMCRARRTGAGSAWCPSGSSSGRGARTACTIGWPTGALPTAAGTGPVNSPEDGQRSVSAPSGPARSSGEARPQHPCGQPSPSDPCVISPSSGAMAACSRSTSIRATSMSTPPSMPETVPSKRSCQTDQPSRSGRPASENAQSGRVSATGSP